MGNPRDQRLSLSSLHKPACVLGRLLLELDSSITRHTTRTYKCQTNSSMVALSSILQGASTLKACRTCNTQQYFAAGSTMAQCKCTFRLQSTMKGTDGFWSHENVTKISMGDIVFSESAPIHPIFRPENFSGVEYDALRPVLRLATSMLLSEHSLSFFYTVMCGEYMPPSGSQKEGTVHPSDLALTANQARAASRKLRMLSSIINFSPARTTHDSEHGCSAVTRPNYKVAHPALPNGFGSSIQFSRAFVDAIVADSAAAALALPDNAARVWNIFGFAKTLGHEVAHAGNIACRFRIAQREPFYGSYHSCSELGFHWENAVFGGLFTTFNFRVHSYFTMRPTLNGPRPKTLEFPQTVVFTPYPQNANVREYLAHGIFYSVRGTLGLFDVFTRVPMKTVATFLTSTYWATEANSSMVSVDSHIIPMLTGQSPGPAQRRLPPVQSAKGPRLLWLHSSAYNQKEYDTMLRLIAHNGKGKVMKGTYSMHEVETQLMAQTMARQEHLSAEVRELLRLHRMQTIGCSASEVVGHRKAPVRPSAGVGPKPIPMPVAVAAAAVLNGSSKPVTIPSCVSGAHSHSVAGSPNSVLTPAPSKSKHTLQTEAAQVAKSTRVVASNVHCDPAPSTEGVGEHPPTRQTSRSAESSMTYKAKTLTQQQTSHATSSGGLDSPSTCLILVECDLSGTWRSFQRNIQNCFQWIT